MYDVYICQNSLESNETNQFSHYHFEVALNISSILLWTGPADIVLLGGCVVLNTAVMIVLFFWSYLSTDARFMYGFGSGLQMLSEWVERWRGTQLWDEACPGPDMLDNFHLSGFVSLLGSWMLICCFVLMDPNEFCLWCRTNKGHPDTSGLDAKIAMSSPPIATSSTECIGNSWRVSWSNPVPRADKEIFIRLFAPLAATTGQIVQL